MSDVKTFRQPVTDYNILRVECLKIVPEIASLDMSSEQPLGETPQLKCRRGRGEHQEFYPEQYN